jgi:hypothetical protein
VILELGGATPEGLRMSLDGEDVTDRCAIRTDRAQPPRRAEIVLAGVPAGEHAAELEWPGGGSHAWRFALTAD